jgi:hypothetical protein
MKLVCKTCGAPIDVKNINLQTMVAACEACNSVFPFTADDLRQPSDKNVKMKTPPGFDIQEEGETTLDIDMNWRRLLGGMEWMVIRLMGLGALFITPLSLAIWNEIMTEPAPGLLPFLGVGISAVALACWYILGVFAFNRTRLTLTEDSFDYTHRPLYWQGVHVPTDEIASIELAPTDQFPDYRALVIVTHDGRRKQVDHFQIHHAQYLQRRLQRALFKPAAPAIDRLAAELDDGAEVRIGDDGELEIVQARRLR